MMISGHDPFHRCSVLVVDHDAATRELLSVALQHENYSAAAVANGREALNYLRSHAETCVILAELVMPVMDARQFRTLQLRDRSLAWIPLIVMSAIADGEQHARDLGARGFLCKPLDLDELRVALRRITSCRLRSRVHVQGVRYSGHERRERQAESYSAARSR